MVETPAETQAPAPVATQTPTTSTTSTSTTATNAVSSEPETFTQANYRANYAINPKPEYPAIARSREWEGKVLLRVQVSAEGLTESVKIDKSSGHDILDDCAIEAVKKWRFIPAKRGDTPVASSVIVPISFSLSE